MSDHQIVEACRWALFLIAMAVCVMLMDWNVNGSPWAQSVNAAKVEYLKKTICN